ncbi:hypothetical protein HGRIS_005858 [Hohenbuehelia grisea]|uniref:Sister chromatid cohesion protein n=1 Tax=Hohenbuehelia grisea TaxID=104357 RepID=A0ABR3K0F2_9AGAR
MAQDNRNNQNNQPRYHHNAVHDANRLLPVYPFASATPSTHAARHMDNLTVTAGPPSFVQPEYFSVRPVAYQQVSPPTYPEYAHELAYLGSARPPVDQTGYWDSARNDAVRFLREEAEPSHLYHDNSHWAPSHQSANYHPNAFAHSVVQRVAPSNAYPTPPPPGIMSSSSSLANALGGPLSQPPPVVHQPQQSAQFFNDFMKQNVEEIRAAKAEVKPSVQPVPMTPTKQQTIQQPPASSPDPLAFTPHASSHNVSPLKRKQPYVEIITPSKRPHTHQAKTLAITRTPASPITPRTFSSVPPTPSTGATSSTSKSTPRRVETLAYIEVPQPKWLTPSSNRKSQLSKKDGKRKMVDEADDFGGYGSADDFASSPVRDVTKSGSRRAGDRDERAPLEKFIALSEDIFEAEDSLPPEMDPSGLPPDVFSPLTADCSRPLLHPTVIRKLIKYISKVAQPTARLRHGVSGAPSTPRRGRMNEVDNTMLSRILKLLDRSVRAGEDIDPFPPTGVAYVREKTTSPRKKSAKKQPNGREKSKTPSGDGDELDARDSAKTEPVQQEFTQGDVEKLSVALDVARDSILAADCCIALLSSDRLPKQLYSEELITVCLSTIKNQLMKIIYPFVEAAADPTLSAITNPPLHHLIRGIASAHRKQVGELFQALSAVLPRVNTLLNVEAVAMSDTIIIQAVYIAIGPFFVVETGDGDTKSKKDNVVLHTLGKSAMRGLNLSALSLLRSIFANHEEQRSWIIEEILTSLIKLSDAKQKAGQFRLRDGRSIRTVSALLLQLVQTSAHDVRLGAKQIAKARQRTFALRRQESFTESQQTPEPFVDDHDLEEIRLYGTGLDSAVKAAKTIVLFLTKRSGKGKATKTSNEAEYRTIFDNLISDLLVVLYWPEWPAASLLLSIASKFMVSSLDDVKSTSQTDNNAAKTIALDHLGVIAARIRSSALKVQQKPADEGSKFKALKPMDEIVSKLDLRALEKLLSAHQDVSSHLDKRSSEDQAYDSARELTAATLGQELAQALRQLNTWISQPDDDDDLNIMDDTKLHAFGQKVKTALREVWKEHSTDVFDIGSQDEALRVDRLAEEIGTCQGLRNSFQPVLNVILASLDAPPIFMRTKALRALGQIVTSDASILSAPNVRRAIESHLLDSSPAVRDAAVELIGKYMIDSPEFAADYYQKIADRIADTGLSVRKRVIKLLKSFYSVTDDTSRRIDIATRIVFRMVDEDDTVKDLAIKSLEELWFQNPLPSALKKSNSTSTHVDHKAPLLTKVSVIMGVAAHFKDRQSPLEDMLHKIMADKEASEASSLHARYAEVCEALIDGLVDASDLPGFTVLNCIRTIHLFTSAYPAILSGSHASTLLPYLKNSPSLEEQATSEYLLKIFRTSIPCMPKTEAKFGSELQLALQPMVVKPSGGIGALQETVACMCAVVQHLTHDFTRLVSLLRSCNGRLQEFIRRPQSKPMEPNDFKALSIVVFIVALLGEHCNFDQLRIDNPGLASQLNSFVTGSVIEHIYTSLLRLYEKFDNSVLRGRILQCLGFMFRAQPTLMTLETSATIMDAIFASPEEEGRGRLLKIMQDFLVSEAAKHSAKEKDTVKNKGKTVEVNMDELVGNTDGFADSGVSSAVVQRYLSHILQAALSQNMQIQTVAIDILSFTIKQGLAHPLQSFPVIVALETSPNASISNRANALHSILHSKHASLLNSRYIISARTSYDYQKRLARQAEQNLHGYRIQQTPMALMQRWYSLVREKRQTRQDFLKALLKAFDPNPSYKSSQDDVDFTRYLAENFASFDYKTQEEVLTTVKTLTSVLSTTGAQLLELISPSHLLAQLRAPAHPPTDLQNPVSMNANELLPTHDSESRLAIMRTTVIVGIIMLLKAHLKTLYSISEDKSNKFVMGKKSAVGDRPAVRKHENPISWERLPYASTPLLTTQDMESQKARFLDVWNEDGVAAEPEDDFIA